MQDVPLDSDGIGETLDERLLVLVDVVEESLRSRHVGVLASFDKLAGLWQLSYRRPRVIYTLTFYTSLIIIHSVILEPHGAWPDLTLVTFLLHSCLTPWYRGSTLNAMTIGMRPHSLMT